MANRDGLTVTDSEKSGRFVWHHSDVKERGCDYCRSDSNMLFGHVEQVAVSEQRGTVLIRCPQCGWLYEDDQRSDPIHISAEHASEWFGYA